MDSPIVSTWKDIILGKSTPELLVEREIKCLKYIKSLGREAMEGNVYSEAELNELRKLAFEELLFKGVEPLNPTGYHVRLSDITSDISLSKKFIIVSAGYKIDNAKVSDGNMEMEISGIASSVKEMRGKIGSFAKCILPSIEALNAKHKCLFSNMPNIKVMNIVRETCLWVGELTVCGGIDIATKARMARFDLKIAVSI